MRLLTLWLLCCCLSFSNAFGTTIVEDISFGIEPGGFPQFPGRNYTIKVYKSAEGPGGFEGDAFLNVDKTESPGVGKLFAGGSDLSEGSDWYVASPGQLFSAESIRNGTHTPWGKHIEFSFENDILLAVNTGIGFTMPDDSPNRDMFGWVRLRVDTNLDVSIVDNAMALDMGRIVVGSNAVPEPKWGLSIGFFVSMTMYRRINRRHH